METQPILREIGRFKSAIPCFNRGCQEEAQHLGRFWHGEAAVHVCLCEDCLRQLQIAQAVLDVFQLPSKSERH